MAVVLRAVALSCLLLLSTAAPSVPAKGQNVIVLMIDGFANNFLNSSTKLRGFDRLAKNGVRADYLKPSFPTLSFPNWLSFATGLYVESHGFTGNFMYDPVSDMQFGMGMGENDTNQLWWNKTQPLWYTAAKGDVLVQCYWWAGCQIPYEDLAISVPINRQFTYGKDGTIAGTETLTEQLDELLKSISKYQRYKKHLVLTYYEPVDAHGHLHGPTSEETLQQILTADELIDSIQEKMEEMGLFETTNLIVLSDHGMIGMDENENKFYVDECLSDVDSKVIAIVDVYASMQILTKPEDTKTVYNALKDCDFWANHDGDDEPDMVQVFLREDLNDSLHFKHSRFLPNIVLMARPGSSLLVSPGSRIRTIPPASRNLGEFKGMHGYDNEHPDMRGIFFARGPAFKQHHQASWLNMVDVYQMILSILQLDPPHAHNGTWAQVQDMLTPNLTEPRPSWTDIKSGVSKPVKHTSLLFQLFSAVIVLLFFFC